MSLKNFQCMLMLIPFSTSMWIFEYIVGNYVYYFHVFIKGGSNMTGKICV